MHSGAQNQPGAQRMSTLDIAGDEWQEWIFVYITLLIYYSSDIYFSSDLLPAPFPVTVLAGHPQFRSTLGALPLSSSSSPSPEETPLRSISVASPRSSGLEDMI